LLFRLSVLASGSYKSDFLVTSVLSDTESRRKLVAETHSKRRIPLPKV